MYVSYVGVRFFYGVELSSSLYTSYRACDPSPLIVYVHANTIPTETKLVHSLPIDTRSTGVAIGAESLGLNSTVLKKYHTYSKENLSSSEIIWGGYRIDAKDVNLTYFHRV